MIRWPTLDLPDTHSGASVFPAAWRCPECNGFFYRPAGVTPVECPYCSEDEDE